MGEPVTPAAKRPQITRFIGHWAILSNFSPAEVEGVNGWRFQTLEHAFQAAKVDPMHPEAQAWWQWIYKAATPADAKRLGRSCPLRPDWEVAKFQVMKDLLRNKFSRPYLGKELLASGDAELIEGNTYGDAVWGAVMGETGWSGLNWLGRLLMEVREELRQKNAVPQSGGSAQ